MADLFVVRHLRGINNVAIFAPDPGLAPVRDTRRLCDNAPKGRVRPLKRQSIRKKMNR